MATVTRRLGVAALLSVAAGLVTATSVLAQAQPSRPNPQVPFYPPVNFGHGPRPAFVNNNSGNLINPRFQYTPGYPINQLAFNTALAGRAYQNVPPWLYGYNPYPPVNYGQSYPSLYGGGYPALPYGASFSSAGAYGGGGYGSMYAGSPGNAYAGSPGLGGYDPSYSSNPYYNSSYYGDPYGGGLTGAANALAAQGKFEIDFQKARLTNQEVERSKIDTRRKIYDEWLYERANTPTIVDIQERMLKSEQRRAVLGMPQAEVLNAHALNILLDDLAKRGNWNGRDPYGPLDPDLLKQVNVTSGTGNVGLLKNLKEGTPLTWPVPLQGSAYQDEVRRLNQKAAEAVKLVQSTGQADTATINDMKQDLARLRGKLAIHVNDLTPSQSVEANRYLNQFNEAVRALEQPGVADYFGDKFAAKGKTVPDLIQYMQKHGLHFAPAVGGDEAAYAALYNALVGYALQAGAGSASSGGGKE
jgi:hypothetical protein